MIYTCNFCLGLNYEPIETPSDYSWSGNSLDAQKKLLKKECHCARPPSDSCALRNRKSQYNVLTKIYSRLLTRLSDDNLNDFLHNRPEMENDCLRFSGYSRTRRRYANSNAQTGLQIRGLFKITVMFLFVGIQEIKVALHTAFYGYDSQINKIKIP